LRSRERQPQPPLTTSTFALARAVSSAGSPSTMEASTTIDAPREPSAMSELGSSSSLSSTSTPR